MALIARISLLLALLPLCTPQVHNAYKSPTNYRKDAKFGRPVLAMANSPRCMFNGKHVEDGHNVLSPEPCLNCTCSKGILLCYLRTCSSVVALPGCAVVRDDGECCPRLQCDGHAEYRIDRGEPSYKYRVRQDESAFFGLFGPDPRTERSNIAATTAPTTTTTRKPAPKLSNGQDPWASSRTEPSSAEFHPPQNPQMEQEEDYGSDELSPERNDSAGYCYHKGFKYTEGMAMLSPTKCEYCYCIRGQQMCVRPKCHLSIDGCVPRYQSGYTCCPSHYQCDLGAEQIDIDEYEQTEVTDSQDSRDKVTSCHVGGYDFDVGVAVPSSGHCQTCYCTQLGVVCRRLECSPSVPGCNPIVPEGHCCPTEYKCDLQGVNETRIPVSHSTEDYDVTVVGSHSYDSETTDDVDYDEIDDHTEFLDYADSDTAPDKQKITVELTDDSDLESISVIPEENIAVLVVTTEKDGEHDKIVGDMESSHFVLDSTNTDPNKSIPTYLKHKIKTSTTKSSPTLIDEMGYSKDTTKPTVMSLLNMKQKTKPSTAVDPISDPIETRYPQDSTEPSRNLVSNMKQKTKTSTTSYPSIIIEDASKSSAIPQTNFKQKMKSTTSNDITAITHETRYFQPTNRPSEISLTNLKHKTKPPEISKSTTTVQSAQYSKDSTSPSLISLTNFKQKTRPPTNEESFLLEKGTPFIRETTKSDFMPLNFKQKMRPSTPKTMPTESRDFTSYVHSTHDLDTSTETVKNTERGTTDYDDENKSNYGYDYGDLYDDVPHDEHETFVPFTDYGETTYGERLTSTEKSHGVTINSKVKIKNKRPPSLSQTRDPSVSKVTTTLSNFKFETDKSVSQGIAESVPNHSILSTFPQTDTDSYGYHPTSYTIYSSTAEKIYRPFSTESSIRQKQKIRPIIPLTVTNTNYFPSTEQDSSQFHSGSETSTRNYQNGLIVTNPGQTYYSPYITDANRSPYLSTKYQFLVTSNRKQKPQRPIFPSVPYKSTKPLPEDIADLLRTITQTSSTESQDTSAESSTDAYTSTTEMEKQGSKISEASESISDALTSMIVAAPKLIIEDTTTGGNYGTSHFETTNSDTQTSVPVTSSSGPPVPSLIFKSPDLIFSNHGPSSHRKQPSTVRVPDPPVVINNHKKTIRPRPQIKFRPSPTPSVTQSSFVEISNHRPSNTFRRPPGKFPPYPSYNNQRSDVENRKQQNQRDPHHSLHRIDPDIHPEWREDYDEYYFDFEQSRNPSTRVFNNIQEHQTVTETETDAIKITDSANHSLAESLQPSTGNNESDISTLTVITFSDLSEINSTDLETNKTFSQDDVSGRSSEHKTTETTSSTTSTTTPTTPNPTTTEIPNTPTKTFSTSSHPIEERKFIRLDDNNNDFKTSFIDLRHGPFEGKPNQFEVMDGRVSAERPVLKPLSSTPEPSLLKPIDPPKSEEDSKEINDVCFVDGRYYNSGEIIVKSNPCEMCRCFYGHPLCQVQQCPSAPQPSCILEYLPGYCCPRITCGVKEDSSQLSSDVSAPDPTNQDIRPPLITSDNQWKPLPHGPIVRPAEPPLPKVETPIPEIVTVPPQPILIQQKSKGDKHKEVELITESSYVPEIIDESKVFVTLMPETTMSKETSSTPVVTTEILPVTIKQVDITTYFPEITTEAFTEPSPVFEPPSEDKDIKQNKSDIHDNSSGVRKVLDETVTLPPSKVSLSPSNGENISTVLPVIQTLPPTPAVTEAPEQEIITMPDVLIGDLPSELGGNLKVSGCNVYGKYYRINDIVTALSKPCSECICSTDGIACNATC